MRIICDNYNKIQITNNDNIKQHKNNNNTNNKGNNYDETMTKNN